GAAGDLRLRGHLAVEVGGLERRQVADLHLELLRRAGQAGCGGKREAGDRCDDRGQTNPEHGEPPRGRWHEYSTGSSDQIRPLSSQRGETLHEPTLSAVACASPTRRFCGGSSWQLLR